MDESNDNAPIEAIRRKERQLAQRLKDAEKRANEKLARARCYMDLNTGLLAIGAGLVFLLTRRSQNMWT
jgi:hypothetical protein